MSKQQNDDADTYHNQSQWAYEEQYISSQVAEPGIGFRFMIC